MGAAEATTSFGSMIEGSAGTMVFGHGVNAQHGEVDEVLADGTIMFRLDNEAMIVIPAGSVVYYRFDED